MTRPGLSDPARLRRTADALTAINLWLIGLVPVLLLMVAGAALARLGG